MHHAQPHRFLAAIIDFYFVGALVAMALSLLRTATNISVSAETSLAMVAADLIAVIVYHVGFSRSVRFVSPGETATGCVLESVGKEWQNRYQKNRTLLFITLLVNVLFLGNSYDLGLGGGAVLTLPQWFGISAIVIPIAFGIIRAGSNEPGWPALLIIPRLAQLVLAGPMAGGPSSSDQGDNLVFALGTYLVVTLLNLVTYFVYVRLNRTNRTHAQ